MGTGRSSPGHSTENGTIFPGRSPQLRLATLPAPLILVNGQVIDSLTAQYHAHCPTLDPMTGDLCKYSGRICRDQYAFSTFHSLLLSGPRSCVGVLSFVVVVARFSFFRRK